MENREGKKVVAIIGAGISGLLSAKELISKGFEPKIFEKCVSIGGLWNRDSGVMWDSLRTNLSKYTCSFTDYPIVTEEEFPNAKLILNYIESYAEKFDLKKLIKFNVKVLNVKKVKKKENSECQIYSIEYITKGGKLKIKYFPYVIIASGYFSEKNIPKMTNFEVFKNSILHSSEYKNPNKFNNKKVVIIGESFSAIEIACDIIEKTKSIEEENKHSVDLYIKTPHWVLPKILNVRHTKMQQDRKIPYDLVIFTREKTFCETSVDENEKNNLFLKNLINCNSEIIELLQIGDFSNCYPVSLSNNKDFYEYIENGGIIIKKDKILEFYEHGIILENNQKVHVDILILCTGYKTNLHFLDQEILQIIKYDKEDQFIPIILDINVFHPDLENFAFVGMMRGAFFPILELQSRIVSLQFSKNLNPIDSKHLMEEMSAKEEKRSKKLYPIFPNYEYVKYLDKLSKRMNVLPDFENLKNLNKKLYDYLWKGPVLPQHFKLFGIDSSYDKMFKEIEIINNKYLLD